MTEWPSLNSLVWLRLPCCNSEHPSRVEDVVDDDCVVAAPHSPHPEPVDPSTVDEGFFLVWTMGRGALEVPVALESAGDLPIPTWQLRCTGTPIETQRRRFVRVDVEIPITMYLLEGGAPTHGTVTTLSEGGVSASIDKWAVDPGGRPFVCEIELEGRIFVLPSNLAWWGRLNDNEQRLIGVAFDAERSIADVIRSYVFSEQLRQRRAVV